MRARWLVAAAVFWCSAAFGQDVLVYPAKGQTPEQQQRDKGECHVWAVQQTGFDPATAQVPPQTIMSQGATPQPVTGSGARVQGAARGAAVGGVVGAIGDDAGEGAAKGAAAGAMIGGMRRRQQNRAAAAPVEQPNPAYQEYVAARDGYTRGVKACLSARGYTVQ